MRRDAASASRYCLIRINFPSSEYVASRLGLLFMKKREVKTSGEMKRRISEPVGGSRDSIQ